jgi:hypothetical protein
MVRGRRKGGTASARGLTTAEPSDIEIDFTDKTIRVRIKSENDETPDRKRSEKQKRPAEPPVKSPRPK